MLVPCVQRGFRPRVPARAQAELATRLRYHTHRLNLTVSYTSQQSLLDGHVMLSSRARRSMIAGPLFLSLLPPSLSHTPFMQKPTWAVRQQSITIAPGYSNTHKFFPFPPPHFPILLPQSYLLKVRQIDVWSCPG